ncbi:MAG: hypothetical protein WAN12_09985 [Candidatus Acidiferrum sp.]|jgi:hypothetical protein
MNRILFGLLSSSLMFFLCACSGLPKTVPPPPPGNATLSLTLRGTPPLPSAHLSILTFRATVTGVSLSPSSGSAVSVGLVSGTSGNYVAEFMRLQSDSSLLSAAVSVPAGTYNSLAVTFSDVLLTFCTQPSSGVAGCSSGSLGQVTGSAGAATASSGAFPLTVTSGEKVGLALDVNIANAITASGQTISSANLAAPNVLTAAVLQAPSSTTDLSSGQLAHIDDLYGVVSTVSASAQSFTLQTAYRGAVSITTNSSTTYDPTCSTQSFSCVTSGALAAVDAILNADGTLVVRNYSPVPFTATAKDTIEGVVTVPPSSVNQVFDIAVTDASFAPSNSLLNGSVHLGDLVSVGVVTPQPFFIVSEGLTIPTNSFSGSTDVSPIQPGQTVAISVSGFAPAASDGSSGATATANGVALRFSRVTGTVVSPTSPQFSATSFPPYFGFTTNPLVQITTTGPGTTTDFDGTSSFTETAGDTVSISALYFGSTTSPTPPAWSFSAATIRKH